LIGVFSLRLIILIFLICLAQFGNLNAKDSTWTETQKSRYSIGLMGGANLTFVTTDLPIYFGADDCGNFEKGEGKGYFISILGSYELYTSFLYLDARVGYENRPAYIEQQTDGFEVFSGYENKYAPLVRNHFRESNYDYLMIDIGLKFRPEPNFPLYLRVGFDASDPIFGKEYIQKERILAPSGVLFPDETLERVYKEGIYQNAGTSYGTTLSLGADLEFGSIYLTPEVAFRFGTNSIHADNKFNMDLARMAIGVRYDLMYEITHKVKIADEIFIPEPEPVFEIKLDDPIPVEPPKESYIENLQVDDIDVVETVVTQTYPILPYLFFDENSGDLKTQYKGKINKNQFSEEKLTKSTLEIYYNTLDIIGSRMSNKSSSKLKITGFTDGSEVDSLSQRLELAKKRAYSVANYLNQKWGIPLSRFEINWNDITPNPTKIGYDDAADENRRVEIYSDEMGLLSPVVHRKFLEYTSEIKTLKFNISAKIEDSFKGWNLRLFASGKQISDIRGLGSPPSLIETEFDFNTLQAVGGGIDVYALLETMNESGKIQETRVNLNVNKSLDNYEVERLNLIVFDFDKATISQANKSLLDTFTNSIPVEKSSARIIGSTDRIGEKLYNKQLSQSRANNVANYILNQQPNFNINEIVGMGDSNLIYDNNLPEGRFYCRTVLIEIKTLINKE